MIKTHHTFFLTLLDEILDTLNNPYLNYTIAKDEIFTSVFENIKFDKLYKNEKERFLVERHDLSVEGKAKNYLFDAAIDYLFNEGFLNKLSSQNGRSYQITHKGFLKLHLGFFKSFENDKLEIENLEKRRKFDLILSILKLFVPAILGFVLGWLANYFGLFN